MVERCRLSSYKDRVLVGDVSGKVGGKISYEVERRDEYRVSKSLPLLTCGFFDPVHFDFSDVWTGLKATKSERRG